MDSSDRSQDASLQDHLDALRSIGAARAFFLLLVVLALIVHISLYCAVSFGRVLTVRQATSRPATTQPATTQAAAIDAERAASRAAIWDRAVRVLIPVSRFVGLVAALLLTVSYLLALNVCLAGRLGGAGAATSAFFWSVLLLALLFPWQHLLAAPDLNVPGAFWSVDELKSIDVSGHMTSQARVAGYIRYIGYPVMAILIALVASLRFCRAYRTARQRLKGPGPQQSNV